MRCWPSLVTYSWIKLESYTLRLVLISPGVLHTTTGLKLCEVLAISRYLQLDQVGVLHTTTGLKLRSLTHVTYDWIKLESYTLRLVLSCVRCWPSLVTYSWIKLESYTLRLVLSCVRCWPSLVTYSWIKLESYTLRLVLISPGV